MSTIIVKDRDDVASVRSARSQQPRHVTTVRRYKYPSSAADDDYESHDTKVVIRERDTEPEPETREHVEYRYTERDLERESDTISQHGSDRDVRSSYRIIERRELERSPSPSPENREIHIVHKREVDPEPASDRLTADSRAPYQLEKYSKSTEYFSRPEPQTIVLRQEPPAPIIIREPAPQQQIILRREEPSYEVIERSDAVEDRQVARPRQDEDYYYERRIRKVDRPHRYPQGYEDGYDRRHGHHDDQNYYSDDDVVFIRREREEDGIFGRDRSPHHKRHLAEGVLAGVAGAEIMRHHRKQQGEDPGSRIGQLVGYGALGGIGAEAISRWRNRSRSRERDGRGRRRSRSSSLSKSKALAGAAALAGIGALAYVAGKNSGRQSTSAIEPTLQRSNSHSRRHTISDDEDTIEEERLRQEERHLDPNHRNTRVAQAGLAGAALAGIVDTVRSRSRDGRSHSRNRIRQGIPIVAAGLGSAAAAGLYERAQAKKEEKRARSRSAERSQSRSRRRSRSVSQSRRSRTASDPTLVEYGDDPIYSSSALERRRSRSRSTGPYSHESPGRRPRRSSQSHSRSRSRSRSRLAGAAGAAAAAGAAGLAAHGYAKRRERRKEREREREREREAEQRRFGDDVSSSDAYPTPEPQPQFYPSTNAFPPPPTGPVYGQPSGNPNYFDPYSMPREYPTYNPAQYGPNTGPTLPPQQDPYSSNNREQYDRRYDDPNRRPGPENVSAPLRSEGRSDPDGLNTPRAATPSTPKVATAPNGAAEGSTGVGYHEKDVNFDLDPFQSESSGAHGHGHEHGEDGTKGVSRRNGNKSRRNNSPSSDDSGDTIEEPDLTDRFDEHGRPKHEDPLAAKMDEINAGRGTTGRLFHSFAGNMFFPSSHSRI